ncbi:MAG TPA: VWA domain-containing protein [Pyrinomonadaceae bacterium]|jgi:hypothetical protein
MTNRALFVLALSLTLALAGCATGERRPDPSNEVVIMLDVSGTYKSRRAEALAKASALLDSIAQTKVRRWEQGAGRITIITVDAVPEVIWQGTLRDLKSVKQSDWAERFKARTDYEKCTDVEAAFRLATSHLQGDPQFVNKYLFAFTDLIHEPPTGSIRTCKPPSRPSVPSEEFPWASLQDVSVSVFWVPPDQKLAWQRAAADNGLGPSFALYTTSESGQVKVSAPPKPEAKITDAEREADREGYTQTFFGLLKWAAIILGGFVALVVILLLVARSRRGSEPSGPAPAGARGVRPLPASKLRRPGSLPRPAGARPPAMPGSQRPR